MEGGVEGGVEGGHGYGNAIIIIIYFWSIIFLPTKV